MAYVRTCKSYLFIDDFLNKFSFSFYYQQLYAVLVVMETGEKIGKRKIVPMSVGIVFFGVLLIFV